MPAQRGVESWAEGFTGSKLAAGGIATQSHRLGRAEAEGQELSTSLPEKLTTGRSGGELLLTTCLPLPSAAPRAALVPATYHGDAEGIDVERVNLPVAADIVNKFDKPVDPENSSYHQDADEEAVCLDSASRKSTEWESSLGKEILVPEEARAVAHVPLLAPTLHCRHLEAGRHQVESP